MKEVRNKKCFCVAIDGKLIQLGYNRRSDSALCWCCETGRKHIKYLVFENAEKEASLNRYICFRSDGDVADVARRYR